MGSLGFVSLREGPFLALAPPPRPCELSSFEWNDLHVLAISASPPWSGITSPFSVLCTEGPSSFGPGPPGFDSEHWPSPWRRFPSIDGSPPTLVRAKTRSFRGLEQPPSLIVLRSFVYGGLYPSARVPSSAQSPSLFRKSLWNSFPLSEGSPLELERPPRGLGEGWSKVRLLVWNNLAWTPPFFGSFLNSGFRLKAHRNTRSRPRLQLPSFPSNGVLVPQFFLAVKRLVEGFHFTKVRPFQRSFRDLERFPCVCEGSSAHLASNPNCNEAGTLRSTSTKTEYGDLQIGFHL